MVVYTASSIEDISKSKNYNGIISVEFGLNLKEIRSSNGTNQ